MNHLGFPYRHDARGRTAEADSYHRHVANLVEQTLLTAPGERVNRPEFGAGLLELVFEPGAETLSEATEFLVRSSLQRWLQDVVQIDELLVHQDEGELVVELVYTVLSSGARLSQEIRRAGT
ncbi:phage baseplate assembly protein W [Actibacterium atlanticum]|uniref:Phage baseplate assembly protein W n=1 Tax=Actibacterium atlanticum TaxID=1461693 RepID=A0A058ZR97_9RHOB|nr:GPW/gp25 family protein [Actibacterium atlanticum]KCV83682.1 phage baseplate assembly protein W [Actibacterium atlanticum]